MAHNETHLVERMIADRLVAHLLRRGYLLDVNDGEETVLHKADTFDAVWKAMFSSDEDYLTVRDATGERVGAIWLIWGNGFDVISDYSTRLDAELKPVLEWAERLHTDPDHWRSIKLDG